MHYLSIFVDVPRACRENVSLLLAVSDATMIYLLWENHRDAIFKLE